MQRYNQRMLEQLKVRQQQEKARLPKIQRSEGKTRMAMYKKSLHIHSSGSASEQREKIKQVRPCKGHQVEAWFEVKYFTGLPAKGSWKKAAGPKFLTHCRELEAFSFVASGVIFSTASLMTTVGEHPWGGSFFPM